MTTQNFKNHIRFYPPHHFVFYPIITALLTFAIYNAINDLLNQKIWIFISILVFVVGWLAFMLRQHYALGLQDRLIINEFKFRYFALAGNRLESLPYQFSDAQIFALRFSEDEDLMELINNTIENDWSSSEIKQNIKNWKADNKRI